MFRRYPYWGWLVVSILLWCVAASRFYTHRQELMPRRMSDMVDKDFHMREEAARDLVADTELVKKIFANVLAEDDADDLEDKPFYLFACDHDSLKFWNTNFISGNCNTGIPSAIKILHEARGVFVQHTVRISSNSARKLIILIPVVTRYSLENDYLKSHFMAAGYIPASTQVSDTFAKDSYPITSLDGKPAFYLRFHAQDIPHWMPDAWMIWLIIAALFASASWMQLIAIYICDKTSYAYGLVFTVAVIFTGRLLNYLLGLPFNLGNILFFSPRLYASNWFLPSLGDLLLNTICVLWIVVYIMRHTPYKTIFKNIRTKPARYLLSLLLSLFLIVYTFGFVNVISSLVIDSSISFDVSHFYAINVYTIIGLFIIGSITGISCLIIYLVNYQVNELLQNKWAKYILVFVLGLAYILIKKGDTQFLYFLIAWLLILIAMLDYRKYTLIADIFEPHMVFWAIFICIFSTGLLQYFNHVKEREARKIFAKQQVDLQRDVVTEYAFKSVAENIRKDKQLKSFFIKPEANKRKLINERFDAMYLNGQLNKYQAKVYLFDENGKGLYNKDTLGFQSLNRQISLATLVSDGPLYYKDFSQDAHYYLAYIPFENDSGLDIGHIYIDLELKHAGNETLYPELLQPASAKNNQEQNEYAYAIYTDDKLITQTGDYPFPVYLRTDTLGVDQFIFYNGNNSSELWYKDSNRKTVVVVHYHNVFIEIITLFSYLFGIEILIAILILLYQLYLTSFINFRLKRGFTNLTLRRRIHFSMLSVVLISFLIIGFVTVAFFISEYKSSNKTKLKSAMLVVQQSVQQYLKQANALDDPAAFDSIMHAATKFKPFITTLANNQKTDINVFDKAGNLEVTSQDDIYDRALLARIIRPDAWYQLANEGKSIIIQDEEIGHLSFLSGYVPIRNEYGISLGYINVPFFSSERDLNFQISNIVVTLINLYAFIFLVSGLITVGITRWLTRSFNLIIGQFGRLNLQRNERIQWPYNDEIGLLVREYNKMVNKVEENAAIMAQSERESAWREMARQVAHEIKNPLTPMKLNIQFLQQALNNDTPNVKELVNKVAGSLVEQIDNLSYIASEFSNFAKMPEARPEKLDLNILLDNAIELYLNDPHVQVTIEKCCASLMVYSDHSQLLRVFTNILENAKQAIPQGRDGKIMVKLEQQDAAAIVSVADNGEGINDEVKARIFQPYFTTKTSGTGLGLAMTRKIIEFWKGAIWFDTIEGEGTTFFIKLPQVKEDSQ